METQKNKQVMAHRYVGVVSVIAFLLYFRFRVLYEQRLGVWMYSLVQFLLGHLIWYTLTAYQAGLSGTEKWCYFGHSILRLSVFSSLLPDSKILTALEWLSSSCLCALVFTPWISVLISSWKTQERLLQQTLCFMSTVGRMVCYFYVAYTQSFELAELNTTEAIFHMVLFPYGYCLFYVVLASCPSTFVILCGILHFLVNFTTLWHFIIHGKTPRDLQLVSAFVIALSVIVSTMKDYNKQGHYDMDVEMAGIGGNPRKHAVIINNLLKAIDGIEKGASNLCSSIYTAFSLYKPSDFLLQLSLSVDMAAFLYWALETFLQNLLGTGAYCMLDFAIAHLGIVLCWLECPDIKCFSGKLELFHTVLHFKLSAIIIGFLSVAKPIPQFIVVLDNISQALLLLGIGLKLNSWIKSKKQRGA